MRLAERIELEARALWIGVPADAAAERLCNIAAEVRELEDGCCDCRWTDPNRPAERECRFHLEQRNRLAGLEAREQERLAELEAREKWRREATRTVEWTGRGETERSLEEKLAMAQRQLGIPDLERLAELEAQLARCEAREQVWLSERAYNTSPSGCGDLKPGESRVIYEHNVAEPECEALPPWRSPKLELP